MTISPRFHRTLLVLAALWCSGPKVAAQSPAWNWVNTLDAGNNEQVNDIAVEALTGNIYVVGIYSSTNPGIAPYGLPASTNGSADAFLAKLDPNGNLIWSRGFGSTQDDAAASVAVASSGLVVVTGSYGGAVTALGLTNAGSSDAFVAAYDASGTFQWAKSVRGQQPDEGTGVAISGSTIVAYGSFTHQNILGGVLSLFGLSPGQRYAYLNAYDLSGSLQWSLTGASNDDIRTHRITSDGTNVYAVGGTAGNTFGWLNSLGITTTGTSTTDPNALFCSAVGLNGTPAWARLINNPGDQYAECNGVTTDCAAVYITGHTHNGSVFPGGITRTTPGVHDYWFLASLSRSTGTTNWVRTASSTVDHGADGQDVSVGTNGQLHVVGSLAGTVTTDGGAVLSGGSDADLCIARFNRDGTWTWNSRASSTADEWAFAVEEAGDGSVVVGGAYEDGLTLGANTYAGNNGTNLFTGRFTDPAWSTVPNNPARFAQPGPICSSGASVNLNNFLMDQAEAVVASSNVASPQEALGASNGIGADFNTLNGWMVLDLGDTVYIGEAVRLTWRSQTSGAQAVALVSSSADGITWSAATTYTTTSNTYITANHPVASNARYIKVQRHGSGSYTGFQLDAVRFLLGTITGGTWSGGSHVTAAGVFTPPSAGSFPVSYTVAVGQCNYTTTRIMNVMPSPVGGTITGTSPICSSTSGNLLMLNGSIGTVAQWAWAPATSGPWTTIPNTSTTLAVGPLGSTTYYRATVQSAGCGTTYSTVFQQAVSTSPSATISYDQPTFCSTDGDESVNRSGDGGGTYAASPAGLWLNTGDGKIKPDQSVPGTYTVTYTLPAANGCPAFTASTTVTIQAAATATIAYPGTPYCSSGGTAAVSITGYASGTFSGNNLAINPATGAIDLAASSTGNRSVTYTIPAIGVCPSTTTSADITITQMSSATISYDQATFCSTDGDESVNRSGDGGGTYAASPAGLWLNTGDGKIKPDQSVPGTYTVTYTLPAANGCPAFTASTTVTIQGAATATIAYPGTPYCSNEGTATATLTGYVGGSFSGSNLSINPSSGAIDLAASAAGNRTVTYTIPAIGVCPSTSTTAPINIEQGPNAAISYPAAAFCTTQSSQNVTRTGDGGGTYTATPAGLAINSGDGKVTPATSAPGTYTVSYTIPATANCAAFSATTSVTITANPTATIAYTGSPYCSNAGTANVIRTGTAGGTFSSSAGLSINGSTGAVDLAASTPGTYTVTYAIAAGGGCGAFSTSATITIQAAPAVTISYPGGPFCASGGTALVTRTGLAGGTYSATPAGLSLDPTTGAVTASTSVAGAYTVSYSVTGANGCPAIATTGITIVAPTPSAGSNGTMTVCGNGPAQSLISFLGGSPAAGGTWSGPSTTAGVYDPALMAPGVYTYLIAGTSPCANNSASVSVTETPVSTPTVSITASPSTAICSGTGVTFSASTTDLAGGAASYQWKLNGVAVGTNSATYVNNALADGDVIACAITVTGGTCLTGSAASSNPLTMAVNVPPVGGTITGGGTYCPGSTGTLTLSGHAGTVLRWEQSTNGSTWLSIANSTNTLAWSGISGTMHFRAVLSGGSCGTTTSATAIVVVEDITPPVISGCPANIALNAPANACSATATWTAPMATDNCGAVTLTRTQGPASGSSFPVGTTIVTYTAVDAAGNVASCSFSVTVSDVTTPSIICPPDITVLATPGTCGAVVSYNAPVGTDNCSGAVTSYVSGLPSGSLFPVGTTVIQYRVQAANNATRTCSFAVTVIDEIAPVLTGCDNINTTSTAGSCGAYVTYAPPTFSELCTACPTTLNPSGFIPLGTQNGRLYFLRATNSTWSASNAAASNAGGHLAIVRSATFNSWLRTAVDQAGYAGSSYWIALNDAATEGTFRWLNSNPVTWTNWASGQPSNSGGNEDYTEVLADGSWNDANPSVSRIAVIEMEAQCNTVLRTAGPASGALFPLGTTTVTHAVTDPSGNSASCSFTVTVTDGEAPSITCPPDLTLGAGAGCTAFASWGVPVPTDNCGATTLSQVSGPPNNSMFPLGTSMVKYMATDAAGLSSTCTFAVIVIDSTSCGCGNPQPGSLCDDGDPSTIGDTVRADCACHGIHVDCNGTVNGTAFLDNCGTCVGGTTGLSACTQDCAGIFGGTAVLDNCGTCVGGTTGLNPCTADCAGIFGGTAVLDNCGTCVGGTTGLSACTQDCAGIFGGTAVLDNCGTCVGGTTGLSACTADCAGIFGGTAVLDNCGTCVGGTTGLSPCTADCAGIFGGTAALDNCGTCVGGTTGLSACTADCAGIFGGTAVIDNCGTCVGGTTGLSPCTADCAGIFGGTAVIDNCGTCVGGTTGLSACTVDCAGIFGGTAVIDNCGTCVGGTTGLSACTADCAGIFGGTAVIDNCGTCVGGTTGLSPCTADCAGIFGGTAVIDNCGTCVGGTTGLSACTADCAGIFGGTAVIDNCGTCVGGTTGLSACTVDCAGIWGGTALPGTTCDDGDANTTGDVFDANCVCAGTVIPANDCLGVPGGTALPGTTCDDGNANTTGDVFDASCVCAGTVIPANDCLGVPGGTALPGTTCDDGNANTTGDMFDANCVCAGTVIPANDCLGVPGGTALPGTTCDDGDTNTTGDVFDANCVCAGTVICLPPSVSAVTGATNLCANETLDLAVSVAGTAPFTYTWSGGGTFQPDPTSAIVSVSGAVSGTYVVTISNACGTVQADVPVTVTPMSDAGWNAPSLLCATNPSIDLNALVTGDPGGTWSGPGVQNGLFDPSGLAGPQSITYSLGGNCGDTLTQWITVNPGPLADAGPDHTVCGFTDSLHAVLSTAIGSWSGNAQFSPAMDQTDVLVTVTDPGTYAFVWSAGDGQCTATDTVMITFNEPGAPVAVDAGTDQQLALTGATVLTGSAAAGASTTWSLFSGSGTIAAPNALITSVTDLAYGDNVLVLTASLGTCSSSSDTVVVHVDDLFIPAGFSPNGDGVNDRWEITGIQAFPGSALHVFNRWGQPVLERKGYTNDWEGRGENGNTLPDDTYFYVLNLDGERTYNGYLIIKR